MSKTLKKNRQPIQEVIAEKSGIALGDMRRSARDCNQRLLFVTFGFAAVMLIALWFRAPLVTYGSPFIYDEDEGHHFNRVVMMLKTGDFNPHYFLKPALHFYLRLPVTAVAFLKGVEQGQLRELREIKTKNPYSLSKFEYTASHPILLKYNRAFSIFLALVTIVVAFALADRIAGKIAGVLAALVLSVAPGHIELSAQIGVDMLMTMFVVISVALSLRFLKTLSYTTLVFAALTAGLAVASKYNAFLVCLIPLAALLAAKRRNLLSALNYESDETALNFFCWMMAVPILCGVGFLIGAPYSIISFPKFLDGAAYEVWHYSDGHSINRAGFTQAMFYLEWFVRSGVGLGVLLAAGLGLIVSFARRGARAQALILALFPLLYFSYMCQQKVNFSRNMLVLLPFLCVYAAAGLLFVKEQLSCFAAQREIKELFVTALMFVLLLATIAPPLAHAMKVRSTQATWTDSRTHLQEWLQPLLAAGKRIAVPGQLAVSYSLRNHPGVKEINFKDLPLETSRFDGLWNQGFDYLLVPESSNYTFPESMKVAKTFAGENHEQRVKFNPGLKVLELGTGYEQEAIEKFRWENQNVDPEPLHWAGNRQTALKLKSDIGFGPGWGKVEAVSELQNIEGMDKKLNSLRWITGRYASLIIDKPKRQAIDLTVVGRSLWPDQSIAVYLNRKLQGKIHLKDTNWQKQSLRLLVESGGSVRPVLIEFVVEKAAAPSDSRVGSDPRTLSVAIASMNFEAK